MFAEQRQAKIVELIESGKLVKVKSLSDKFKVSTSTIRRDLDKLEKSGEIQRIHGGALAKGGTKLEPSFVEKEKEYPQVKESIAQKAAGLINDGDTIILDAGTTTTQLAKLLDSHKDLTIVTNAINIALELAQGPNQVLLTGGYLKKHTLAMVGPIADINLKKFHANKVFLGANGIDLRAGVTTPDLVEANSKKIMIQMAKEVIVLADHSKFEETAFIKIADLESVDKIITDNALDNEVLNKFKNKVRIITT